MRVSVKDGSIELYSYDTDKTAPCLSPAMADKEDIRVTLREALRLLGKSDKPPKQEPPSEGT